MSTSMNARILYEKESRLKKQIYDIEIEVKYIAKTENVIFLLRFLLSLNKCLLIKHTSQSDNRSRFSSNFAF